MNTRARQTGLTMISWIILVGMIGFIGIFGFKLFPIYMDYYSLNSAMTTAAKNVTPGESPAQIRTSISSLFDVNSVNAIKYTDVDIKTDPDTKSLVLSFDYDQRTNFFGNVDLIVHFERTYPVNAH
ncbi:MAG TPA: DUF4845 domain-containing protein [Gammaproteobacteria bacterium]|nr:DUF4845 domain-containing protein [Gammaproteobacteria bacterium]